MKVLGGAKKGRPANLGNIAEVLHMMTVNRSGRYNVSRCKPYGREEGEAERDDTLGSKSELGRRWWGGGWE